MALLDFFQRGAKRAGENLESYIGGLLGEDISQLSEQERKQLRRQGMSAIFDAMARGTTPTQGLAGVAQLAGARLEQKRLQGRQKAAEEEMQRISAMTFGGAGPTGQKLETLVEGEEPYQMMRYFRQDPKEALRRMYGTSAGRDVAAAAPDLFKLAQEGVTGRTVGDAVYNPLTGQFSKAPKEKSKTLTREEVAREGLPRGTVAQYDANGNLKIVYQPRVAAPAAGTVNVPGVGAVKLTQGEQQRDKDFAKGWTEFSARGGFADTAKQLEQLQDVLTRLESGEDLTGAFTGFIMQTAPSIANALMAGKVSARDAVEEVVQRNLRMVLGPQFTKEEGDRLIARAYNPSLGEEENAVRLTRLIRQILSAASSTQKAGEYFDKFGTLKGYSAKIPSFADFNVTGDDKTVDLGEVPEGIDPRDWEYMTEEQRKLWK